MRPMYDEARGVHHKLEAGCVQVRSVLDLVEAVATEARVVPGC